MKTFHQYLPLLALAILLTLLTTPISSYPSSKANEYTTEDCTPSDHPSFPHHKYNLGEVTMDDSTKSVYLAGKSEWKYYLPFFRAYYVERPWRGHCKKRANGKGCIGQAAIMVLPNRCFRLDSVSRDICPNGRIECVS
ncbi:hypothetical protein EJ08DRAFT_692614 [Tothia fuscella]|uniref:Uncharacterized protein n=1 Tax=Tothia fuscella TaxID=1048955 RepID=A0A9P4P0V5_9PEZI|nr:hypothetical protein EJ08DRAFT_692614 [Tothia fuscella]